MKCLLDLSLMKPIVCLHGAMTFESNIKRYRLLILFISFCCDESSSNDSPSIKFLLQLSFLKVDFPEVPIVALTATARSKVMKDTMKILGILNTATRFSAGFDRPNLYFKVRQKPSSTG